MNLCGLGKCMIVNVVVREWMCLNVRETTCESVCLGAHIHVNVWVFVNGCG